MNRHSSKSVELFYCNENECNISEDDISTGTINTPKVMSEFENVLVSNKGKVKCKDLSKFSESTEPKTTTFEHTSSVNIVMAKAPYSTKNIACVSAGLKPNK